MTAPTEALREQFLDGRISLEDFERRLDAVLHGDTEAARPLLERLREGLVEILDPDGGANVWAMERATALVELIDREAGA